MAGAYWISCYRSVSDPAKVAAYAKLAGPAIEGAGGTFIARGTAEHAYESGAAQRTVLIAFASVAAAVAAYESPAYREALAALGDGADRDIRIVAGI